MQIRDLTLYSNDLVSIIHFYSDTIGLKIHEQTSHEVSFKIGNSILRFHSKAEVKPYHFAINIPNNKVEEALDWLKKRVAILPDGSNEIIDFKLWNAKAIYFYDSDSNIVEFIARKDLDNASDDTFGIESLLTISEIGVVQSPVDDIVAKLRTEFGLPFFREPSPAFTAIGDHHGLFICVDPALKKWFPTMEAAHFSPFKITVVSGKETKNLSIIYKDKQQSKGPF